MPSHSAEGAARNHDAALGRSDYYGQQERGLWAGKGAEMLGLRGQLSGLTALYINLGGTHIRATGIMNFLENDGHTDNRTTKLYDRRGQKILLEDMERIRY
jgi:hypothetical protein